MHFEIIRDCTKQYVLNLYKFLKAKAGLETREKQVQERVTNFL